MANYFLDSSGLIRRCIVELGMAGWTGIGRENASDKDTV
jgi:hypothetical protein